MLTDTFVYDALSYFLMIQVSSFLVFPLKEIPLGILLRQVVCVRLYCPGFLVLLNKRNGEIMSSLLHVPRNRSFKMYICFNFPKIGSSPAIDQATVTTGLFQPLYVYM